MSFREFLDVEKVLLALWITKDYEQLLRDCSVTEYQGQPQLDRTQGDGLIITSLDYHMHRGGNGHSQISSATMSRTRSMFKK